MVEYLSIEKVIEFNLLSLTVIKAKRADSSRVLSRTKIDKVLVACKNCSGDIYDKATVLLKGLIRAHAFASGNRRTAFLTMKYFLIMNNHKIGIEDKAENAKVFLGIRENYYSDSDIKGWIAYGKIKEFKR